MKNKVVKYTMNIKAVFSSRIYKHYTFVPDLHIPIKSGMYIKIDLTNNYLEYLTQYIDKDHIQYLVTEIIKNLNRFHHGSPIFKINEEILRQIENKTPFVYIEKINNYIPIFLIGLLKNKGNYPPGKFVPLEKIEQHPDKETEKIDNAIIEEMLELSKDDWAVIYEALEKRMETKIRKESLEWYKYKWAESKAKLFIRMGHKLRYTAQDVDFIINMDNNIKKIIKLYPNYAHIIELFTSFEIQANKIDIQNETSKVLQSTLFHDYPPTNNMKVSKWLSRIINNNNFDMEFSKLYQIAKKNKIIYSISPIDLFFNSANNNEWKSCYNFYGLYEAGMLSFLVLNNTGVIYITDQTIVDVKVLRNYSIKVHNKIGRSFFMIHFKGEVYKNGILNQNYLSFTICNPVKTNLDDIFKKSIKDIFFGEGAFLKPKSIEYKNSGLNHHYQTEILNKFVVINNGVKDMDNNPPIINLHVPLLEVTTEFMMDKLAKKIK